MILVDFHVHLYDCFSLSEALTAAAENFQETADKVGSTDYQSVLCLTESCGYDVFGQLQAGLTMPHWRCETTGEEESLVLVAKARRIILVAGRQINTHERVEVLALGTRQLFGDNLPLQETLKQVVEAGGLPVLPWGVGKWSGHRGRLVSEVLLASTWPVFAGDNGGRPYGWPTPGVFAEVVRRERTVLPGSDPLPISAEQGRIGSFGAVARETLGEQTPGRELLTLVRKGAFQRKYGTRLSPLTFCIRQLQLRLPGKGN